MRSGNAIVIIHKCFSLLAVLQKKKNNILAWVTTIPKRGNVLTWKSVFTSVLCEQIWQFCPCGICPLIVTSVINGFAPSKQLKHQSRLFTEKKVELIDFSVNEKTVYTKIQKNKKNNNVHQRRNVHKNARLILYVTYSPLKFKRSTNSLLHAVTGSLVIRKLTNWLIFNIG